MDKFIVLLDLKDKPSNLWNFDKTVSLIPWSLKKFSAKEEESMFHKQSFGEKKVTTFLYSFAVLHKCIRNEYSTYGHFQRCMNEWMNGWDSYAYIDTPISKGLGWINDELFVQWFQHFIKYISFHMLVLLFMYAYASHMTTKILWVASNNDNHLVTFQAHTTHLLQPLDAGNNRPLKEGSWIDEMKMLEEKLISIISMGY
jgi:hypothetical protein